MAEENLPSEEEIKRGEQAIDILQQLSDVLLENLEINRQNVDAIRDSVTAAGDLAAPFNVTKEQQKEINKAFRDSASLNAQMNASMKERVALERDSASVNKDLDKAKNTIKRYRKKNKSLTDYILKKLKDFNTLEGEQNEK